MDVIQMITVLGYTITVFGLGFTLGRYTSRRGKAPFSMSRWPSNEYKYSLEGRIAQRNNHFLAEVVVE